MQTFLPYPRFAKSAKVLDRARLGKQRVEVLQILTALVEGRGWIYHPATKMWRGHEQGLVLYGVKICDEWVSRGYKDTCRDKILAFRIPGESQTKPAWLGDEAFHRSHQSNLIRKFPDFYKPLWPDVPDNLPYIWPEGN